MGRGAGLGWWGCDERWFSSTLFFPFPSGFIRNCIYTGQRRQTGQAFFFFFQHGVTWKRRVLPDLGLGELLFFFASVSAGRRELAWQEARGKTAKG